MNGFTISDFPGLALGDKRRDLRFVSIINNVIDNPSGSIPQQCNSWSETKAVYKFFTTKQVSVNKIKTSLQSHGKLQIGNVKKVLIAHDFCHIDYTSLKKTIGLGYKKTEFSLGIVSYNSLAISPEGSPLSLLYQETFTRPLGEFGKSKERKDRKFEEKESYHWQIGMQAVNNSLGADTHKIHIADREADIYELFANVPEDKSDLLIRSTYDRKIDDNDYLWQHIDKIKEVAELKIKIPENRTLEKVEIAVSIKFKKITILRPANCKSSKASVELNGILLQQTSPKLVWQEELVEWKLLTTLAVLQLSDAVQCVQWYCYRWLIERFHYVLKSGTEIEKLQLEEVTRLQKAIHVHSIAAVQLMKLTYLARTSAEEKCTIVLSSSQWKVLLMLLSKSDKIPSEAPTIGEAVKLIGRLGGHLGRKSDGPPGLKTIWRGYRKLMAAVELYEIMQTQQSG
jgi:hypothetical protein